MPGFEWFGEEEKNEVLEVLDTGVLFRYGFDQARKGNWKARELEAEICRSTKAAWSHVCSSGTAALLTALAACGIGAGDEVIVPPFTFIATLESVLLAGAVPIFTEIDETLCLDPESLNAAVTPRTRAVLPVHMCGSTARIDEIVDFCSKKGLVLIEDACQAFGATHRGKAAGTFGKAGCFSFDPVKTITCGEGGAVVTDDRGIYLRADRFADHGHDHKGNDRGLETHDILGANFRISELNAAVGLAQIRKLDTILDRQRSHKMALKDALKGLTGITFRQVPDEDGDSSTFLSFFMPDESRARQAARRLAQAGVDGCFYWYDNNWHYLRNWEHLKSLNAAARLPVTLLQDRPDYSKVNLQRSDSIMGRAISIQIRLSWSEADLDEKIQKMTGVLRG